MRTTGGSVRRGHHRDGADPGCRAAGARLDPPLLLAFDEIANLTPLPSLPSLMAEGGRVGDYDPGCSAVTRPSAAPMGRPRGRRDLGRRHRQARPRRICEASRPRRRFPAAGEIDEPTQRCSEVGSGSGRRPASLRQVPVMPPSVLRTLPFGTGVLLLRHARPVVIDLQAWPDRSDADRLRAGRAEVEAATAASALHLAVGTPMSKFIGFGTLLLGVMAVPAIAILALVGQVGSADCLHPVHGYVAVFLGASACPGAAGDRLDALGVSRPARAVDRRGHGAGIRIHPDAYAADVNGGRRGLFRIDEGIWRATYGAGSDADLDHNGVWDVKDPEIHAAVAGKYLCKRLEGVRRIRAEHPDCGVHS